MENLSTKDSLKIIQTVIEQRKRKYEENGFFLLLWGALVIIAGVSQYIMIAMGKANISGYVWLFTMIPGFIFTFISSFIEGRKKVKSKKPVDRIDWIWAFVGCLAMTTGFIFGRKFGIGFTAMLFIPFCVAALASALSMKNNSWTFLSIIAAIVSYGSIFVPFKYHPLIAALVAFLLMFIPGLQFYINHKKRK